MYIVHWYCTQSENLLKVEKAEEAKYNSDRISPIYMSGNANRDNK